MAATNDDGLTFEAWVKAIDALLIRQTGLRHSDFADAPYRDNWADGVPPEEMLSVIAEYDEILAMFLNSGEEG